MDMFYKDLLANHKIEDPIHKLISQIANFIKNQHDYDSAIRLIKEHNLKLVDIVTSTKRLTNIQVVELANRLILLKWLIKEKPDGVYYLRIKS